MSVPVRLAAFAAAVIGAVVLGLGIGQAVGPFDDEPGGREHTDEPVRGGFGNHDHP